MCGIAGFIDFTNTSNEDVLKKMTSTLAHRGPDGQSVYYQQYDSYQLGLGHSRLSIIDLSNAAGQPMVYENLVIVFNGEIYNYNEIKEDLLKLGHQFITKSDTEVILHSWKEWGSDAIHKWHGMFAIAIFDSTKNELICIRDRAGVKPFYYYFDNNVFLFGSELKAIMQHTLFQKRINTDAVASFLQYGYISAPHSIFNNAWKLEAGHLMNLNLSTKEIKHTQYWNVYDYYNQPKLKIDLQDAVTETEGILEKAFQYRMVSDVPVGVFLSGGFDSTCVTALLQKNNTEKIKTFTIGTTDSKLNEAPFAKEIAKRLGTEHTEYYCSHKEALEIIPELPVFYDEPFADSSAVPTILVSRMAREKVTVALSADAGDEIFAGYNRYSYYSSYGKRIEKLPGFLRKVAARGMEKASSNSIPYFKNSANFHSRYDKIKNLLKDPSPGSLLKSLSHVFSDAEVGDLFLNKTKTISTKHNYTELKDAATDPLAYMMAIDYQTYMVDDILQKVDRATMSASLEGREPFLDQDIIQWAARLPSNYKYHDGLKKYILKEIVYKYVPKELMDRPKKGFAIPVSDWLQNELRPLVEEYINEDLLKTQGLFNIEKVISIKSDFFSGRKEKYLKLWYILMFQMWYKKWM